MNVNLNSSNQFHQNEEAFSLQYTEKTYVKHRRMIPKKSMQKNVKLKKIENRGNRQQKANNHGNLLQNHFQTGNEGSIVLQKGRTNVRRSHHKMATCNQQAISQV